MKKKIILSIVLLIGISCFGYFWNKYAYAKEKKYFLSATKPEKGLQIGIIGDSWLVRQKLDSLVTKKISDRGVQAKIYSYGNPGATTRTIFENLFKNKDEKFSSKEVIEKKPDYCIIVAGVNDAATHVGPDFYAHHMMMMIKAMLHYNIQPVVVTLPEFGIEEDFKNKNIISEISNRGGELILNKGIPFKIQDYRKALSENLKNTGLEKKVIILNFDEVTADFDKDRNLFADPLHLNKSGYQKFSEFLVNGILNLQSKE